MKLKFLISNSQHDFHTSELSGRSGSKLVNFGLMLNCFGPVRSGENIIGSVRGRGHKIYYFSVRSGSGQKITGHYGVGVPKTLPRRTLIEIHARDPLPTRNPTSRTPYLPTSGKFILYLVSKSSFSETHLFTGSMQDSVLASYILSCLMVDSRGWTWYFVAA